MFGLPLPWFRLFGGIALGLGVMVAGWLIKDRFVQARAAADARACNVAAADDLETTARCLPGLAAAIEDARHARLCGEVIARPDRAQALFAIRASCPAGVLREVAARAAAEASLVVARSEIDRLRGDQLAAVERAEARVSAIIERKGKADAAIQTAPRRADGGVVCDARCLRDLAGQ